MSSSPPKQRLPKTWSQYPETILEIYRDGWLGIDLRVPLSRPLLGELSGLGLGSTFAVITAANPGKARLSEEENHRRVEALDTQAASLGFRFLRADGVSPDGNHRERGIAIALDKPRALALAASWDQSALFWFDGERVWILGTAPDEVLEIELPLAPPILH